MYTHIRVYARRQAIIVVGGGFTILFLGASLLFFSPLSSHFSLSPSFIQRILDDP